jgi:SAM-dependent methyltransferase
MKDAAAPRSLEPDEIRRIVRERYAAAITAEEKPGGGTGCCTKSERPLVADARSSFGCGDPLALAGIREGETVLDVGSGPGADAIAAARRVGPAGRVIGVDMTPAMLKRARQAAADEGLANVEFRQGDAERLPVEDGTVDWVISNCVVNLVPDKRRAFAEIHRVLRPGGRFSITDLVGESLPPSILDNPAAYCSCLTGAPSEEAYLQAIRDAGFEDLAIVDRFAWEAPELEGTDGKIWSLKLTARKGEPRAARSCC